MKQKRKNEVKKLRCSYFLEGKQNLCLGYGEGLMVPSIYELENFCLSGKYLNCSVRLRQKK